MTFEQMFPGYLQSCADLHDKLMPAALALLALSFAFFFWSAPPDPMELIKFVAKLFIIMLCITHARTWIDSGKSMIRTFVQENVKARPDQVAERYKAKLNAAQNSSQAQDQGWWDMLFSANFFESIVYAILWLLSWFAMVLLFYVNILQDCLLLLYWVISPFLFACFAIPMVSGLALRHVLRILGTMLWPLGLALAATITDGLIDLQTQQFGNTGSVGGAIQYVLMNLLAVTVIAVWVLASSVLAPVVIQRLIAGQAGAAGLIPRATSLLTDLGLPILGSRLGSANTDSRSRHRDSSNQRVPLVDSPELESISPTDSPSVRKISDDDPTAEKAVKQMLEDSEKH